jgi:tetratricopeptide (TPR) repeat protein
MTHAAPSGLPEIRSLWNYDQPAESEKRFREILPAAQASGDRSYHLQLLTQIARAECLQRKYDLAHATLDHVRSMSIDDLPVVRVRYLLERGRVFNDTGNYDQAKRHFLEAWDLARASRLDGYAVDAAHMMGIIEPGDQALEWNLEAVRYAKASDDPEARRWLATLQNNIGWTYFAMQQYDNALEVFQDALQLRIAQGSPGPVRIARYSIAKARRMLGQLDQALKEQTSLLGECERAGEPDGYVHEEIAECLLAFDQAEDATPHFARAYQLLSKDPWFPPNEKSRLERIRKLGLPQ